MIISDNDLLQIELETKEALKQIDLKDFLSTYGSFTSIEDDLIGKCPFHGGNQQSLVIKPESMKFHCIYNKCNKSGSIIQLIAQYERTVYEKACETILNYRNLTVPLVQQTLQLNGFDNSHDDLIVISQTKLRLLYQCPLRFWNEYVKKNHLDNQSIQSTIGSLLHSTMKDYYKKLDSNRSYGDLLTIFAEKWGKGRGIIEEREYWFKLANESLQHAYDMNIDANPKKMEWEKNIKTLYPQENPICLLESQPDRIDWFSENEYNIIDYKWDERVFSEEEALNDFQTILYFLTWTSYKKGIPPKKISYQFFSSCEQIDLFLNEKKIIPGIDRLNEYITFAQQVLNQTEAPESKQNFYCYNCKLNGRCPSTQR